MNSLLLVIAIGLMAGVFSGIFGIGGGVVIVPALVFFLGMTQKTAQGTTLAMLMFPVVALGAYNYWKAGEIEFATALWLGLGFVVGGYLGSQLALWVPESFKMTSTWTIDSPMQKLFALLMIFVAIRMLLK